MADQSQLQALLDSASFGIAILPGEYQITQPLRIPPQKHAFFSFAPMPGAIFHLSCGTALFSSSALLDIPSLLLVLQGGNTLSTPSSTGRIYIQSLLCSAPGDLTQAEFLQGGAEAEVGRAAWSDK